MELIFELCAELFLELFGESFVNLYICFIPKKTLSDKKFRMLKRLSQIMSVVFIIVFIIGIGILVDSDGGEALGWIFLFAGLFYFVLGLVLRYIASIRKI